MNDWKIIYHANRNQKQAHASLFTLDKADCKVLKIIKLHIQCHFELIKESIQ
jgi:hypothetical protein